MRQFWYFRGLTWFNRFLKNLLVFLNNKLAVELMFRHLLTPLFHDTSFLGRILSFVFRLVRVVLGSAVMLLTVTAWLVWLVGWLSWPFILGYYEPIWLVVILVVTEIVTRKKGFRVPGGSPRELMAALGKSSEVREIMDRLEMAPMQLAEMEEFLLLADWIKDGEEEKKKLRSEEVGFSELFLALLKINDFRYEEAVTTVEWLRKQQYWQKTPFLWDKDYSVRPMGGVNRAWTGIPTPTLDKFSTDLTAEAGRKQLPEIIGKEAALDELSKVLSRQERNNAVIIGEPGSGKTTLIKGLAQEIVRGVKFKKLQFKRVVALDTAKISAGANSAEVGARITTIIDEIKASENIILFVDEVHNLASINQDNPETADIFIALEPPLSEGKFQFIGATSTSNYKKYVEPNEAFARLFETVELGEANKEDTLSILQFIAWGKERKTPVTVSTLALMTIIELAGKLIHDRVFPDKAVNLLDEVVAYGETQEKQIVTTALVEQLVTRKTKVPVGKLKKKEAETLLKLEEKLHQSVVGQDQAITAIADAIRRARTSLKDERKPIASFLFAGPTGVGKTESAKTLAREFFGSEKTMIRIDMSEYQTVESANKLIGAPPGTGETNIGGQLTEAVRHQPYTLILLDEIEKAHEKIQNLFLQVLDDARLTDSSGKTVDFANTIIIATTNAGSKELAEALGKSLGEKKLIDVGMAALESKFPPEWLNRFTEVVVFKPLNEKEVRQIAIMKLEKLKRDLEKQEVLINFDEKIVDKITEEGFSLKWGGRQVDRAVQNFVANVVAKKILQGEIVKNKEVNFSLE